MSVRIAAEGSVTEIAARDCSDKPESLEGALSAAS